jgi:hypothetical protein
LGFIISYIPIFTVSFTAHPFGELDVHIYALHFVSFQPSSRRSGRSLSGCRIKNRIGSGLIRIRIWIRGRNGCFFIRAEVMLEGK